MYMLAFSLGGGGGGGEEATLVWGGGVKSYLIMCIALPVIK